MDFPTLVREVTSFYHARIPTFTWGAPGIGKSAAHMEVAKRLADNLKLKGVLEYGQPVPEGSSVKDYFGFIDVRLLTCDAVEVGGFPDHDKEHDVMRRVPTDWFPHTGRNDLPDFGIILFDEWNAAPPSIQAASYQVAQDRRISDKVLKPGWNVHGAGNRVTDGGAAQRMQTPLANRMAHFELESNPEQWTAWGLRTGELTESIVAYLRFSPDSVNAFDSHNKAGNSCGVAAAFATERTWHKLAQLEKVLGGIAPASTATALVGEAQAVSYAAYAKVYDKMPDIDAILKDPHSEPVVTRADVLFAVTASLAARVNHENLENAVEYMKRLDNPAFATRFITDAMSRHNDIHATKGYQKWVQHFGE
ncbi:MAG: hypothetical protein WD558_03275, partial [Pseudomonadales bacterium]